MEGEASGWTKPTQYQKKATGVKEGVNKTLANHQIIQIAPNIVLHSGSSKSVYSNRRSLVLLLFFNFY